MAEVKPDIETCAKIKVIGVGGGGGSALNRMIAEKLRGIDFIAVNTDAQALHSNMAANKIPIGKTVTRGLGAGMNPEMGRRAAEENANEIRNTIGGADMVFLTCGLGGGTGSGAAPEIAKIVREAGALTVAVVTKPFAFEGAQRKRIAEDAYHELAQHVDTIITIPNDRVLQIIDKKTSLLDAFKIVDDVLRQGVQGISEIITLPGLINVDFADVKAIMANAGSALMGIGRASGENRAVEAAKQAIASPLLEISIDGAKGILFTVTGGPDLAMYEVAEAAKVITGSADDDARVIFGANIDEKMGDEVRITVVATGFDSRDQRRAPSLAGDVQVAPHNSWVPSAPPRRDDYRAPIRVAPVHESPFESRRISPAPASAPTTMPQMQPQQAQQPQQMPTPAIPVPEDRLRNFMPQPMQQQPQSQPYPQAQPMQQQQQQAKQDDDDLGIPAFIRRKMM
ncbi:MAG: Cell division protein FtsZ [Candidatus Uhrbacteria bacterium GW2011_GWD2_52_7]|uniref:Cell division protein FtsZ n=1 Tax=Candidatus Uhrbacteria bacterium GW2011_GWD2_52_7 TaxID=1618989 RepID=A0A0G1ZJT2_9BACT|nr:MAG: Cell division protein FtsZ [Candidatus Uhrbacteria bacterium GW2011_GWD2_52_7]